MNLVFFTHPLFIGSQSMPRFAHMLAEGMRERGHTVSLWSPRPRFFRFPAPEAMKKWMGYVDQFLVFPAEARSLLKACSQDTLFVFTDQALGPWVPLVQNRPHVIHCHDFLAQRSALGEIPEHQTRWTGRFYQAYIRRGYSRGKHFISVSENTRRDLEKLHLSKPISSLQVYNGLNQPFTPVDPVKAGVALGKELNIDLSSGYLLHVGGNQWYKNRTGLIDIYNVWRSTGGNKLPLLLIGASPTEKLKEKRQDSLFRKDIHFLSGLPDESVRMAYSGASLFLFPSLAEGFGWPIAEAMASGCPVITTGESPMKEVAGGAAFFIPKRRHPELKDIEWAFKAARVINEVLSLSEEERRKVIEAGYVNVRRFNARNALDRVERIYENIMETASAS